MSRSSARVYALACRRLLQPECCCGVAIGHLLVVPQHEDLAVERVHAIERCLKPDPAFGANRRAAGAGQFAHQPGGQGTRACAGHHAPVDRNLAAGIAADGREVPPVLLLNPLADQEAQPDVKRHGRVTDEFIEAPHGIDVTLLDDVRGVDTPL